MDISTLFAVLLLVFAILYWFLTRTFDHWKKQNVPFAANPIPGFGHLLPIITVKENIGILAEKLYKKSDGSIIGFYFLRTPAIVACDPEIVKCVLQTNFLSFSSNLINLSEKNDPVLSKNPFFVADLQKWKMMRSRTINHLSSKKLKYLFVIIQEISNRLNAYTDRQISQSGEFFECELKPFFNKFTGEIVANAAFGIDGQSFADKPDRLSFTNVAKSVFEPTFINGLKQALLFYLPSLADVLQISFLAKTADEYFRQNLQVIVKERLESNTKPNDFLQFCIETSGENDIDSLIADVIIFFGDVYETSSVVLSNLFYCLSKNQDVQSKLRNHIKSKLEMSGSAVTFDCLKTMNYLDQTINESMRLIPPIPVIMKLCTEKVTLQGSDGLTCHLEPGNPVFIPIRNLHNDKRYWVDPDVFDPERFNTENQANNTKFAYLPFGEGPRMCVGMRLGLILVKLATISLITKFSINPSLKTKEPLEMDPSGIFTLFKGGLWVKFEKLT